jgi:hypothetical protein
MGTPEFDYSTDELRKKWAPEQVYGTPGSLGARYESMLEGRTRGYGSSPADVRQQQALGAATQMGAQRYAAQRHGMGAQGALRSGLLAQQQGASQAFASGIREREVEQQQAQQDYVNLLKSKTAEQIGQDKINAAYSQLNLESLLAQQQARRKQKGGLFGGVGGMLASVFGGSS